MSKTMVMEIREIRMMRIITMMILEESKKVFTITRKISCSDESKNSSRNDNKEKT